MKRLLQRSLTFTLLLLLLAPAAARAQRRPILPLSSRPQPVRLSVRSAYQRYEDDGRTISAWTVPISAFVPVGRHLGFKVSTSVVSAEQQNRLSGLDDVRASLGYTRPVGNGSFSFSLGVNVPVGKSELSPDEFETATLLAQNEYDFHVPGLGQGLNVSPGLTYAYSVSENLSLGLGAAYQYRGSYEPRQGRDASYDPGDEVLVTGGLDVGLAENAALSGDVTYTFYGNDALGDNEDFYEAGDKLTATMQFSLNRRLNGVRLLARYRTRAKSNLLAGPAVEVIPDQIRAAARYRRRLGETVALTALVRGRFFGKTDRFEQQKVFDVGLAPVFMFSNGLRLRPRFIYTLGDFTGFDAGLGLEVNV